MESAPENQKEGFIPSENNIYPKSNLLISGKYKSTLLENQIMAYSFAHADQFDLGQSERETIKSTIKVSELRKLLGANSGSFYQKLSQTAESMTGRSIGMSTPDGTTFDYISVVTRARCKDGIFTIEYNGAMRSLLVNLQRNYSKLNLTIQMKFRNNYAFRLYELLKQKCYHSKDDQTSESHVYKVRMNLAELKLELGIVNADLDSVRRVLKNAKTPDYEKAVEKSPERMFDNWSDFKRKVLDKALAEINEVSDLRVSYETLRQGVGGKVKDIDFTIRQISMSDAQASAVLLSEDEKVDLLVDLRVMTGKRFPTKDLRAIAEAAGWDAEKVEKAYDLFLEQKDVANPTGWMIRCLQEGYERKPEKEAPAGKKAGKSAHGFPQNEYDFSSLEKMLLGEE